MHIQYPPHVVVLGVVALISSFEQLVASERPGYKSNHQIAAILSKHREWELKFQTQVEALNGMYYCHRHWLVNLQ